MVPDGYRRLFIALPVPQETGKQLTPYCAAHETQTGIRWIPAPNRHLTLVFLGHRTEEQTQRAITVVNGLKAPAFQIELLSLQRFPDDRGRNLVALPLPCAPLTALQQQLAAALATQGFTLKQRDFRPHITLGKIHRGKWQAVAFSPSITMQAQTVTLFQSQFVENAITYQPLASRQLG